LPERSHLFCLEQLVVEVATLFFETPPFADISHQGDQLPTEAIVRRVEMGRDFPPKGGVVGTAQAEDVV
jgi:hypothetical protein